MTFHRPLGLLAFLTLMGCATAEELDALKATMNATMTANRRSLERQIKTLENQTRNSQNQEVTELKQTVSDLTDAVRRAERETADIRASIPELRSLRVLLDAEEAFYRDRLRAVQSMRHALTNNDRLFNGRDQKANTSGLYQLDTLTR